VWRIVVGLSLIPAFGTLYQRLTLPESTRFISAQRLKDRDHANEAADDLDELKAKGAQSETNDTEKVIASNNVEVDEATPPEVLVKEKAHFSGMFCDLPLLESE
jgi:PHS family inorganic phosphate transporter-like MFS transporter